VLISKRNTTLFNGSQFNEQMMYVRGMVTIKVLGSERNMRPVWACQWANESVQATHAKGIFLLLQIQRIMGSVKVTTCHQLDARIEGGLISF